MRAALARAACAALRAAPTAAADAANSGAAGEPAACAAVTDACARAIRELVADGQPPALPCPHSDCGALAVRVGVQDRRLCAVGSDGLAGAERATKGASAALEMSGAELLRAVCGDGIAGAELLRAVYGDGIAGAEGASAALDTAGEEAGARMTRASGCGQEVPGIGGIGRVVDSAEGGEATQDESDVDRGMKQTGGTGVGSSRRLVQVELGVTHNSGSMGWGYWAHDMAAPRCSILRQQQRAAAQQSGGSQDRRQMCCEGVRKSWSWPVTEGAEWT